MYFCLSRNNFVFKVRAREREKESGEKREKESARREVKGEGT